MQLCSSSNHYTTMPNWLLFIVPYKNILKTFMLWLITTGVSFEWVFKTQSCKSSIFSPYFKILFTFHPLICLISSHHFLWLLLTDSLLFFWYWHYQVLLLPVSILLTVVIRFGFQLFLQLQQPDSMRFHWDYCYHLSCCQCQNFLDLEDVVHLLHFRNLKLLKVVWILFCYLLQNPAFQLTLKIMIL